MILGIDDILKKLENAIEYKNPFSHIRFGDGGIKFIHSILFDDRKQLKDICKKEGIPFSYANTVLDTWSKNAREADFIDTPEVYFNGKFWPRVGMSEYTAEKLKNWKFYYDNAEFDNENYCNPESNYLMLIRRNGKKNLIDIMRKRKICIITVFPELKNIIQEANVDIVKIVGKFQKQFDNSFSYVINKIKKKATAYDFWMVAAGELGRIYTGTIKENGGRAIDIGYVAEVWLKRNMNSRLRPFLNFSTTSRLELLLTNKGKEYEEYL